MLIDTHCHLDFEQFDADRQDVINRAKEKGIGYIINVAADLSGAVASLKLAAEYDFIFAAAGIHPHYALKTGEDELKRLRVLTDNEKVVALGEVGLDYYNHESREYSIERKIKLKQQELLCAFIEIAKVKELPIIFHCREAHEDLLAILKDNLKNRVKAVVHCFSGTKEFLKDCLDSGLKVSFTANITYKKADGLRALVYYVPLEEMFLETDAPFLTPQAKRGKRNEPSYTRYVAQEVARIKNVDEEKVADITTSNARLFFNI
ncbi:MAG: TatD family hydrolase [Candidatus Omnitrophica bacterium]|nr:TatD family hydrolase [Candidatus Omnitrophota bacterium]